MAGKYFVTPHAHGQVCSRFPELLKYDVALIAELLAKPYKGWKNNSLAFIRAFGEGQVPTEVRVFGDVAFLIREDTIVTVLEKDWLNKKDYRK